jgi:P-type conjugative transfer protein TrbJ
MLRTLAASACLVAVAITSSSLVPTAQAGGLPGVYGTEWTQIANNVELGNINAQTISQLAQALQQTSLMIQQAKTMNVQLYGAVFDDIAAVEKVVQAGQGLAYNMANLDSQWNIRYTFGSGGANSPNNYGQQYQKMAQASMDSVRGTLNAVTTQGGTFQSDAQMVANLQNMAKTSVGGSLQAEQALIQIVSQQLAEQQKLRQLMLADLQSKEAIQAQQIQQQQAGQTVGQMTSKTSQTPTVDTSVTYPDDFLNTIGVKP